MKFSERLFSRHRGPQDLNGKEVALAQMPLNLEVEVTRVEVSSPARIHRLASLGLLPGARVRLLQNRGAYLAQVDRSQIAFDAAVARAVWVKKIS
ncbi:MAG: ferrous iron transport protein A [Planctomycetes bacterium]|nr:ferrous iron transport protein A [Planctomycetota bacterium]